MQSLITIRRKEQKLRCPVCLDLLYVGDFLKSCSEKHAAVHQDCLGMVQSCPTLGCDRSLTVTAKFCKRPRVKRPSDAREPLRPSKYLERAYSEYMDAHQSLQIINWPIAFFLFCFGMAVLLAKAVLIPFTFVPLIVLLAFRESFKARKEESFEEFGSEDRLAEYGLARLEGLGRFAR